MKIKCGSITVFAALSIMLIAAVLFTFVEAGRTVQLKRVAKRNADSAMESMFARYQIPLWEKYHLLGLDGSNEMGQLALSEQEIFIKDIAEKNVKNSQILKKASLNLLRIRLEAANFEQYTFLTDGEGRVFQELVSTYMKEYAPAIILKELQDQCAMVEELSSKVGEPEKKREAVLELSEKAKSSKGVNNDSQETNGSDKPLANEEVTQSLEKTTCDNPIKKVEAIEKKGILNLVLEKTAEVSQKEIHNPKTLLSRREKTAGVKYDYPEGNITDKILMEEYFQEVFCSFDKVVEQNTDSRELSYEIEYLLEGKMSDRENLKEVAEKLVGIREVANLTYLLTDGMKISQAESLAITLAGVTANPVIVEIVKLGILASWAYSESILDVRALLKGYKVAIIKTREEWTLDIANIGTIGDTFAIAKECKNGITYSQYISSLIMLQPLKSIANRALDLTERSIQQNSGYEHVHLDQIIVQATVNFQYDWKSIFLGIGSIGRGKNQKFAYGYEAQYAYYN